MKHIKILLNALNRIQRNCCSWDADGKPDINCKSNECISARIAYKALRRFYKEKK